jgi:hypothetical protein
LAEGLSRHHDDLDRRGGGHGGVAARVGHQAHLAEEVAGAQLGQQLVPTPHLHRALFDREELVGPLALAHEVLPLAEIELVRARSKRAALFAVQTGEQRYGLDAGFVHLLTSLGQAILTQRDLALDHDVLVETFHMHGCACGEALVSLQAPLLQTAAHSELYLALSGDPQLLEELPNRQVEGILVHVSPGSARPR